MHLTGMKKIITLGLAALFAAALHAQSKGTIKIYGYRQAVVGGVSQRTISENGASSEVPVKPRFNYRIYTVSASAITPLEIWIKGEAFSVSQSPVEAPVVYTSPNNPIRPTTITLVPKTTKKVLQVSPEPLQGGGTAKAKTLAKANELVLVYKANGRTFYQTLKKLETMEPAYLQ
jgi:hypothetical protein